MSSITDYLLVFAIGGAICVIGQLLMSLTRLTPARILVIFVTAGVVLTAVGLYKPIVELGGAGATVPLTGFGYSLANGAIDGAMNEGLLGAITGGVKATAGGIAAAVLFGYAFYAENKKVNTAKVNTAGFRQVTEVGCVLSMFDGLFKIRNNCPISQWSEERRRQRWQMLHFPER